MATTVIAAIHIIACIVIILFVLLQSGKGAEAGAMFGGGGNANSLFGGAGPASFLAKVTAAAGLVFFVTSVGLTLIESEGRKSVVDRLAEDESLLDDTAGPSMAAIAVTATGSVRTQNGDSIDAFVRGNPGGMVVATDTDGSFVISGDDTNLLSLSVTAQTYVPRTISLAEGTENLSVVLEKAAGSIMLDGNALMVDSLDFAEGSAELSNEDKAILDTVVAYLKGSQIVALEIRAHTDSSGDAAANKQLSTDRAEAVRAYIEQSGISAQRLSAQGYGGTVPIADNATAEGRAANRRIEFFISVK